MSNFETFFKELPTEPGIKGFEFEKAIKWWLENDYVWSSQFKKVWLWNQFPGKTGRDTGIDLVAESNFGELWAIQCKAYDPDSQLKKSDIDSFLSASNRKLYKHRLLVTTTKGLGGNARETLAAQEKPVQIVDWFRLCDSDLDWMRKGQIDSKLNKNSKILRPHQINAIKAVTEGLKQTDRGQLIMACGSGKTLTALRIHEQISKDLTVVLVPSLTLLSQVMGDWLKDRELKFSWLAVCSDESVTKDPQDNARLIDFDFPATTKADVIQSFLNQAGRKVIFSTYQSSLILINSLKKTGVRVDLAICDEAHRLTGKMDREFSSIFDETALIEKRLFMTATPRMFSPNIIKKFQLQSMQILSMSDVKRFGQVFFTYSFSKAITDGVLTDYRVVIVGVTNSEVSELLNRRQLVKAGAVQTDAESLAIHIGLSKAMKKWKIRRSISFHSRVANARKFAKDQEIIHEWLPGKAKPLGKLIVSTVSSSMPTDQRRLKLDNLKSIADNEFALISNARCLTEGIDVPTLDGIVFVDPKSSQVDIVQAVGRAIRIGGKEKTHGTIVIPVFLQEKANQTAFIETTAYSTIWSVLNALRAHDEALVENLDKVRTQLGARGILSAITEKIIFDLPKSVGQEFINSLKLLVVERSSDDWNFRFGELSKFAEINGHCRVPARDGRQGKYNPLGGWIIQQRIDYKSNLLGPERVLLLSKLPGWSWDPIEDGFKTNFEALEKAVKRYGDVRSIPRDYVDSSGIKVGQWLMSNRSSQGKKRNSPEKRTQFEKLPGWSWNFREDAWFHGYRAMEVWLQAHIKADISCINVSNINVVIPETGYLLSNWVKVSLKQFRKAQFSSVYTKEKHQLLAALPRWNELANRNDQVIYKGMNVDPVKVKNLELFTEGMKRYKKRYGNLDFPITSNRETYEFEGYPLGRLANHYRTSYKRKKLEQWEINELDNIDGWIWDELVTKWNIGYEKLLEFVKINGHAKVPQICEFDNYPLGSWVARQRRAKRNKTYGSLSRTQMSKLEELPGWIWDASKARSETKRSQTWDQYFKILEKYVNEYGSAQVPAGTVYKGIKLGRWVAYQRAAKLKKVKGAKITKTEIAKLESLKGWQWKVRA